MIDLYVLYFYVTIIFITGIYIVFSFEYIKDKRKSLIKNWLKTLLYFMVLLPLLSVVVGILWFPVLISLSLYWFLKH